MRSHVYMRGVPAEALLIPPDESAPVLNRPVRRPVAPDRADHSAGRARGPASRGGHARGRQCDPVPGADRLRVATPSPRLPTVGNGCLLLPPMADGWCLAAHPGVA